MNFNDGEHKGILRLMKRVLVYVTNKLGRLTTFLENLPRGISITEMDHSDLVAELPRIEKLTAAERLKIARDRRINQILRHEQYERDWIARKDKYLSNNRKRNGQNRGVHFVHR